MLSYRHIFHAGNHADILKHVTLSLLLEHLNAKAKPYTVIDTHAGAGRYDLSDERARKTAESDTGILKLLASHAEQYEAEENAEFPQSAAVSEHGEKIVFGSLIQPYISLVQNCLAQGFYPGSPEIERHFMRNGDALILCELHNNEIEVLKDNMKKACSSAVSERTEKAKGCSVQIHHRDGFEALHALTPPTVKRGLVLTDPSYEDVSEYGQTADSFSDVNKRWPAAVLALWYPLLAHRSIECGTMKQKIISSAKGLHPECEILDAQLLVNTADSHEETSLEHESGNKSAPRLYGSGMLVVNMPWKLDEELTAVLPVLARILGTDGKGSCLLKRY